MVANTILQQLGGHYPLFPYNHPEQRQTYFSTGCNSILNIVQSFKL